MNNFVLVFDRNFQLLLGNNYNDDSTNKKKLIFGIFKKFISRVQTSFSFKL